MRKEPLSPGHGALTPLPTVTVIIPVKPGGAVKALEPLSKVEYPKELVEIIVAEGAMPSRQRNLAAAAATGEFLYFLDDDSLVFPFLFSRVVRHFSEPQVAVVGGPSLTPATDSLRQRAFGAALSSLFGGGSIRNRYRKAGTVRRTGDHELILCNLCFRKDVFLEFGGLNERLYPNEENELMDRISSAGLACVHDPELAVQRSQRRTFRDFVRQMVTYGRGRGEQTLVSRRVRFPLVIPSLFVLYLLLLPHADNPVYYVPLLCYALMALGFSLGEACRSGDLRLVPPLFPAFVAMHLAYGAGLVWGLLRPRHSKTAPATPQVQLRKMSLDGLPAPSNQLHHPSR